MEHLFLVHLTGLPGFDATGLYAYKERGRFVVSETAPDDVYLDFREANTRDRAARWLAGRNKMPVGCTAPTWRYDSLLFGWELECWAPDGCETSIDYPVKRLSPSRLLDPHHSMLLPDGSRVVDAAALAIACKIEGARVRL